MQRHDLVTISKHAELHFACVRCDSPVQQAVRAWIQRGRPLVVARQVGDNAKCLLALCVSVEGDSADELADEAAVRTTQITTSLTNTSTIRRVAVWVHPHDIVIHRQALRIEECLDQVNDAESALLFQLATHFKQAGIAAGIYGSLAWEVLSGQPYRHQQSDIDLICDVQTLSQLKQCLQILSHAELNFSCALDGEIRLPNGYAFAWKELNAGLSHTDNEESKQILYKSDREVGLIAMGDVFNLCASDSEVALYE